MGFWHHNDLTVAAGAPDALSVPAGYVFATQGTQHVVYRGTDNHVHELWWDSNGWHHNDLTTAASAPITVADPAGYAFEARGELHVVSQGFDNHIHELWWNAEGWHHKDLTIAAGGAPEPDVGNGVRPAAYAFEAQGTQHVIYLGGQQIHEVWWDINGWHYNNLTIAGGAPTDGKRFNFAVGVPAAYVFAGLGEQHVIYQDTQGPDLLSARTHIHELWWNAGGWHHNDLNIAAASPAGPASNVVGNPTAYAFDAQGTQHVVYRGIDAHFHELWWDGNGWHYNDLTIAANAPEDPGIRDLPEPGFFVELGDPTGYTFDAFGEQHVIYRGSDNHIHQLWWDNSGWHHNDLTIAASAPEAWGEPTGYVFEAQRSEHVIYLGADNHIHELRWGIEPSDKVRNASNIFGTVGGSP